MSSIVLMPDTGQNLDVIGLKYKGDGYLHGDGLHTVGMYMSSFIGRIFIQGTLAEDPAEEDWFNIMLDGDSLSYQQFDDNTDGLLAKNFTGNFLWIRAKIDRSYLVNPDPQTLGSILKILMKT